jgi:hypothetical protein
VPGNVSAQDAHYWTHQYGTRSNLLGGAVVGSVVDISASFYNPGALALIQSPDLIQTSKVIEASGLAVEGGRQPDIALDDLRFSFAPGFFGGLLPFAFLGRHVLGYSVFTRYRFKATVRTIEVGVDDLVDPPAGLEDFFGEVRVGTDMSETWIGLSWASPLGSTLGVGITQYVAARSKKSEDYGLIEAFSSAGAAGISISDRRYSYWNYDLLWKIGLSAEWQGWSLGLTVTTPRINLFGSGRYTLNSTVLGQDLGGDGAADPVFVADHQENLGVTYKSPTSVALGAARKFGSTTVHTTVEWFAPIDQYATLEPTPFIGQSTGDTVAPALVQEADHVINVGVGVEQQFEPTLAGYASFRTDFSSRRNTPAGVSSLSRWNIYYLTAGISFEALGVGFTAGMGYGFGSSKVQRTLGSSGDLIDELPEEFIVRYRNVRLILAFAF